MLRRLAVQAGGATVRRGSGVRPQERLPSVVLRRALAGKGKAPRRPTPPPSSAGANSAASQAAAAGGAVQGEEGEEERPFVSVDKRTLYEDVSRLMRPEKVEKSPMTPLGELLQASIKRVTCAGLCWREPGTDGVPANLFEDQLACNRLTD